ncbi:Phloem protein 2 A10 [Heracleum sosnowskyi]|uniref:Phloem protein 2 A10 n=1 Tax=Heracleum sosnowskyi TaxID=360622 RepID=A0AAD8H5B3_9APIA|nr:Phloem protein 2 A10 [Heracleum sosnowskyi]
MDMRIVEKGLDFTRKRKKWVYLVGALGFSGYGAYRVYNLPTVVRRRERLLRVLGAFGSLAEAVADSAEVIGIVSKDFNEFVKSDSDQVPNSLRQISKLTMSEEFTAPVSEIMRALAVGILRGYQSEQAKNVGGSVGSGDSSLADQVLDKLFSKAGSGFASVVVGSLARNMVVALSDSYGGKLNDSSDLASSSVPRWVEIACDDKFRNLIADSIQLFVSTAVAAYLEKTMDINTYDELFTGLTNPKHETQVRETLATICNGAVETFVRTSHQVLTSGNSNANSDSAMDLRVGHRRIKQNLGGKESLLTEFTGDESADENQDSGWANKMYSTLAVPSNRRFVLDMTGRVTFETVRSFLDFLLEKLSGGVRSNLHGAQEEVIDKGFEAYRYVTAKSTTIVTICLSLCLHILNGPWILVPTY